MFAGLLLAFPALAQLQLREGTLIEVISFPLNVRDAPGTGGNVTGRITEASTAVILGGGPYWADGYWWWPVDMSNGQTGWIAEGDTTENYISALGSAEPVEPAAEAAPAEQAGSAPPAAERESTPPPAAPDEPLHAEEPLTEAEPASLMPEPIEVARHEIADDAGGLRFALALFGPTAGRGGPAFSWAFTGPDEYPGFEQVKEGHFWCERKLLTHGPPWYARFSDEDEKALDDLLRLTAGHRLGQRGLRFHDFEVSCSAEGGLQLQSQSLTRTLAALEVVPAAHGRAPSSGDERALAVSSSSGAATGEIRWLELLTFDLPESTPTEAGPQLYPIVFEADEIAAPDRLTRFAALQLGCEWLEGSEAERFRLLPGQSCRRQFAGTETVDELTLDPERGLLYWLPGADERDVAVTIH